MALLGILQGGRYTVGGPETFDSLTDLVEHFRKTGIEEASGAFVYLRQVRANLLASSPEPSEMWFAELSSATDFLPSLTPALLCHSGKRSRH